MIISDILDSFFGGAVLGETGLFLANEPILEIQDGLYKLLIENKLRIKRWVVKMRQHAKRTHFRV